MSYELQAVVAGASLIEELAGRFLHATTVPMNRGLALIPVSGRWLREVARPGEDRPYPEFGYLSRSLAEVLRAASVRGPVAYVEIEEMLDRTGQAALAWSGGELALPPREVLPGEAPPPGGGPVTEAFRLLGVTCGPGQDAWASFGLYRFSRMQQWLEVPELIGRLPQMELVWGQPDEDWAGFDFDTDYQTRAGGHSFRLRAGAAPGGARYTVLEPPWSRAAAELDQLPGGWHLHKRRDDTVIVAAGSAWLEYRRTGAYVGPPGRACRVGLTHLGFYADGAIQPLIAAIEERHPAVAFTRRESARRRAAGQSGLADLIERLLDAHARADGDSHAVVLLSGPGDPGTIDLGHPVVNDITTADGQPQAWTLGQRYTRLDILRSGVTRTSQL